jgi:hypothetical protein
VLSGANVKANKTLAFLPQHIDSCLDAALEHALAAGLSGVCTSYIPTEPAGAAVGGGNAGSRCGATGGLAARLARALGEDLGRIQPTDTLTSLGMDSLQSVEVANILRQLTAKLGPEGGGGKGKAKLTVNDLRATPWSELCLLGAQ